MEPVSSICAILREESLALDEEAGSAQALVHAARVHGVAALSQQPLAALMKGRAGRVPEWMVTASAAVREDLIRQTVLELAHARELRRVFEAAAGRGLHAIVFKGTALAHTHYAQPAHRQRSDTDMLFPPGSEARVRTALQELGYHIATDYESDLYSAQCAWFRTEAPGVEHHLDVHFRVNNLQRLANLLSYEELASNAVPVPALGPQARAPNDIYALLIACTHRAAHMQVAYHADDDEIVGGDRLIWLYDIHLLVSALSPQDLAGFARLARAKRVKAVCLDGILQAQRCFATAVPAALLSALRPAPGDPADASARILREGPFARLRAEFSAVKGWGRRMRWLWQVLVPPEAHMRRSYPDAPSAWLPMLHAWRWLSTLGRKLGQQLGGRRSS